ncbi:MAG: hypothetical protein NZM37_12605, partial [Sandaracinaceae bacterium]|nr:hypothetical protein [Sandaracinaceae bacterium]
SVTVSGGRVVLHGGRLHADNARLLDKNGVLLQAGQMDITLKSPCGECTEGISTGYGSSLSAHFAM